MARPAVAGYVSGVTSWEQATSQAAAALALWDEFPVEASPRPLVLTGQTVLFTGGFPSDQAKLAFLQGAVSTTVPVPAGLLDALCPNRDPTLDDTLLVVGAEPTTGTFPTDRGPKQLPAWTVTLACIHSPFTVRPGSRRCRLSTRDGASSRRRSDLPGPSPHRRPDSHSQLHQRTTRIRRLSAR